MPIHEHEMIRKEMLQEAIQEQLKITVVREHLLPFWGTIKKSPSALQKAQPSIDLLAAYLHVHNGHPNVKNQRH